MPNLPAHTKQLPTKMLPRLDQEPRIKRRYRQFAEALWQAGYAGDIRLELSSRVLQSTDNSIYQRIPQGVLYPADADDVVRIARLSQREEFHQLSFCPRGGGTGTNGQALGEGFVVDMSRHMNRVLEINPEQGWARVQAGVVKDQLNAAVREHGLFFPPDLSTSNRATIGGMINTDASGQGSCRYGKTRDHVLALDMVLADGSRWTSKPIDERELGAISQRADRMGDIHRLAERIERENRPAIARIFPPLNRCLTGYDLAHLRDERGRFDLNSLLCGSEGTLAFIVEAVVNLEVLPRHTALVVVHYDDFVTALRDARQLMAARPTAVETMDDRVVALARSDAVWSGVQAFFPTGAESLKAVNFVEFSGHSEADLNRDLQEFSGIVSAAATPPGRLGQVIVRDPAAVAQLWAMRKRSVGLLGKTPGRKRPLPFVEDTAVPPEHLANYIADFRELLDEYGLDYGMFGHADAGVIHVRPLLDLRETTAMETVRSVSDRVFALVRRYGGVLWGEHGKGLRSHYSPETFGELYPELQRIKASFDPHNQLNPGKLATPSRADRLLDIDEVPTRGDRDRLIPAALWEEYGDAVNCNGNAACFNWDPDQVMCPSWKASRERKYSPKGRASLMKEWLAQLAEKEHRAFRHGAPPAFSNPIGKMVAGLGRRLGRADFSHQVFDSMDNCLACKACATGCPVQVDVPAFRSAFFGHYFGRYWRPLRHYAIAGLETLLPLAASAPAVFNFFAQNPLTAGAVRKTIGLTALPVMERCDFRGRLKQLGVESASPAQLQALSEQERQRSVILVLDVFTRYLEPSLVLDTIQLLQALGFRPWLAPFSPNGKPLHVLGFLPEFRRVAGNTAARLRKLAACDIPLVGLEPSMTLTYRDEYRELTESEPLQILLLQEWLASRIPQLEAQRRRFAPGDFRLLPHCSEASLAGSSLKDWAGIFAALGSTLRVEVVGCCGMAGTYGHENQHAASSRRIFELSWAAKIESGADDACATGFSCRSQAGRFSRRAVPHPVQRLLQQLV